MHQIAETLPHKTPVETKGSDHRTTGADRQTTGETTERHKCHPSYNRRIWSFHLVPRSLPSKRKLPIAARGIAEVVLNQFFHIIIANFQIRLVRFPKHMMIACTEEPSLTIHEPRERQKPLPRRTSEKLWNTRCKPLNKPQMDATTHGQNTINAVSTVNNKPHVDHTTQMARHTTVCDEDSQRLSWHWRDEIHFSNNYEQWKEELLDMISDFEYM